ncbi:hypothetical protein D9M68_758850 [compost metagenome]
MARLALVEGDVQVVQLGADEVPVVQGLLQFVRDAGRIMRRAQVARDHDELSVARAVLVGGEFHESLLLVTLVVASMVTISEID